MKIVTNRKIVDLQNKSNDFADAEYESVVRGDFHSADGEYYDADGDDEYYDADGDYSNDSFSYADDAKKTGYFSKAERDKRKAQRGVRQKERKDDRIATRIARRENRKAKYGARPLNPFTKGGKQFWKDNLPKLRKKSNGKFEKTLPDGSKAEVDAANALIIATEAAKKAAADAAAKQAASDAAAKQAADTKNAADIAAAEAAKKAAEDAARKAAEEAAKQVVVDKNDVDPNQKVVLDANGQPVQDIATENTETVKDESGKDVVFKKSDVVDDKSAEAKKPMSNIVKYSLIGGGVLVVGVIGYLIYKSMKNK